jgi:hypothetical protein
MRGQGETGDSTHQGSGSRVVSQGEGRQIKALIEKLRGIKKALPDAIS